MIVFNFKVLALLWHFSRFFVLLAFALFFKYFENPTGRKESEKANKSNPGHRNIETFKKHRKSKETLKTL